MQSFFEVVFQIIISGSSWPRLLYPRPKLRTAETLVVDLNIYLTKGEHTSIVYTDLKKYVENIETAEEIEAITSLIQASRLIWPELAMNPNLEWTIRQLGLSCMPILFLLFCACNNATGISKGYCTVAATTVRSWNITTVELSNGGFRHGLTGELAYRHPLRLQAPLLTEKVPCTEAVWEGERGGSAGYGQ